MIFVSFVATVVFVAFVAAQAEPSDAELTTASAGRIVRVGMGTNGGPSTSLRASRAPTEMPLEVYVARVLAGEGEPQAADAAQQALAIAIRTFAAANLGRHGREGFDLCDTTHCQAVRTANSVSRRATLATAGQLLLYDGHPAELFYSASCGGRSESAPAVWPGAPDYPYLPTAKDEVCEDDPPWVLELSSTGVHQALRRAGFEGTRLRDIDVERRSGSGRVTRLGLSGLRPDVIAGDDFRAAVGANVLKSTAFTVKKTSRGYRFEGRGFGHGVGMCVIGAGRRAARGESAPEIVRKYYPGLQLAAMEGTLGRVPPPASPGTSPLRTSAIAVRASVDSAITAAIEQRALAAHGEIGQRLGTSVAPISIELHSSLDSFRHATGRPWWVSSAVTGTAIDLAPAAVLAQREGVETAIRVAVAEVLIGSAFAGRPDWMRVGAARYFARPAAAPRPSIPSRLRCPSDAELTMAVSATAQREAEARAEACFARALTRTSDWRMIR